MDHLANNLLELEPNRATTNLFKKAQRVPRGDDKSHETVRTERYCESFIQTSRKPEYRVLLRSMTLQGCTSETNERSSRPDVETSFESIIRRHSTSP